MQQVTVLGALIDLCVRRRTGLHPISRKPSPSTSITAAESEAGLAAAGVVGIVTTGVGLVLTPVTAKAF